MHACNIQTQRAVVGGLVNGSWSGAGDVHKVGMTWVTVDSMAEAGNKLPEVVLWPPYALCSMPLTTWMSVCVSVCVCERVCVYLAHLVHSGTLPQRCARPWVSFSASQAMKRKGKERDEREKETTLTKPTNTLNKSWHRKLPQKGANTCENSLNKIKMKMV